MFIEHNLYLDFTVVMRQKPVLGERARKRFQLSLVESSSDKNFGAVDRYSWSVPGENGALPYEGDLRVTQGPGLYRHSIPDDDYGAIKRKATNHGHVLPEDLELKMGYDSREGGCGLFADKTLFHIQERHTWLHSLAPELDLNLVRFTEGDPAYIADIVMRWPGQYLVPSHKIFVDTMAQMAAYFQRWHDGIIYDGFHWSHEAPEMDTIKEKVNANTERAWKAARGASTSLKR